MELHASTVGAQSSEADAARRSDISTRASALVEEQFNAKAGSGVYFDAKSALEACAGAQQQSARQQTCDRAQSRVDTCNSARDEWDRRKQIVMADAAKIAFPLRAMPRLKMPPCPYTLPQSSLTPAAALTKWEAEDKKAEGETVVLSRRGGDTGAGTMQLAIARAEQYERERPERERREALALAEKKRAERAEREEWEAMRDKYAREAAANRAKDRREAGQIWGQLLGAVAQHQQAKADERIAPSQNREEQVSSGAASAGASARSMGGNSSGASGPSQSNQSYSSSSGGSDGEDATSCVGLKDPTNTYESPRVVNQCSYSIEVVWCTAGGYSGDSCERGWRNMTTLHSGGTYPVQGKNVNNVKVAACKGKNTLRQTGGLNYNCVAPS